MPLFHFIHGRKIQWTGDCPPGLNSLRSPDFLPCLLPSKPQFIECSEHIKIKMAKRPLRTGGLIWREFILSTHCPSLRHILPLASYMQMGVRHLKEEGWGRNAHTSLKSSGLKPLSPREKRQAAESGQSFNPTSRSPGVMKSPEEEKGLRFKSHSVIGTWVWNIKIRKSDDRWKVNRKYTKLFH